ncbi:MAG: hypothetical protein DIU71_06570 [Proteobacteria bacterium]|nr:MAG: hypothetical protein DIU71_06570 [Pseudomonadota bacterium]
MNVRFADQAIRCRILRAELDQLLSGRALELEVALPHGHVFRVNVRGTALGGWRLDSDPTGLWISVPRAALDALVEKLPSKEGIGEDFESSHGRVRVSLEVDLKDKKRTRAAAASG